MARDCNGQADLQPALPAQEPEDMGMGCSLIWLHSACDLQDPIASQFFLSHWYIAITNLNQSFKYKQLWFVQWTESEFRQFALIGPRMLWRLNL